MTEIRLYNTATRAKAPLEPLDPRNVRMYVCGPTVYDRAHLGNGRPVVVFDTLFRLLRHVYGAGHVTYVRNFTDVDDKINAEALRRQKAGAAGTLEDLIRERTEETIDWYHADMDALGALRPTFEPRATEYIGAMVAMTLDLVRRGHAYAREGHVLFRVRSYAAYGALSGRSVDDMIAGARVEVAPFKEDPMDFVLWKPSSQQEPGWDSPWGRGRPGWHIECSAMSHELLGKAFDIHGGGLDLQFPHHENEIAQSACMGHGFAKVWMHNEMLQVEGKKMSKSLGNFFTVRDLLDQGYPGEVIRMVYLGTHYRSPMDWTEEKADQAERILRRWSGYISTANYTGLKPGAEIVIGDLPVPGLLEALSDDLNTSLALTCLLEFERQNIVGKTPKFQVISQFLASISLLGFSVGVKGNVKFADHQNWLMQIAHGINDARSKRQFAHADRVKSILVESGFEVQIGKDGARILETRRSSLTDLKDRLNAMNESMK